MKKIIFGTIFVTLALLAFSSFSYAQTTDESVEQLREKSRIDQINIEEINNKLKILSSKTVETVQQKNVLSSTIKELTAKRNKLVSEKNSTDKKIKAAGIIIKTLSSEISTKNKILDKSNESLSSLLKNLYQQDQQPLLIKLLSEENLDGLSRTYNDVIYLNSKLNKYIKSVTSQREILDESKNKKEDEQEILNSLKKNLITKEQEVVTTKKEKDALLVEKKKEEEALKKETALLEKQKEDFERAIEDYESQIKYILNPSSIPKEGSILSWPLTTMILTSSYGPRVSPYDRSKIQIHRGIDLRAKVGTNIYSMASGIVDGTGNTDIVCRGASWGNWILVKYNNGLSSLYGHLSSIKVSPGDKVTKGDIIGLSGGAPKAFGAGSSKGPHLHLSVYASSGVKIDTIPSQSCDGKIFTQPMITASNAYLDPTHYLPKF